MRTSITIPEELYVQLKQISDDKIDTSVAMVIRAACREYVTTHVKKSRVAKVPFLKSKQKG